MKTSHYLKLATLLLIPVVSLCVGCSTCKKGQEGKAVAYDIMVELDRALQGKSVLVDLVGVNPASFERWKGYSMTEYWRDGDALRRDANKITFNFASNTGTTNVLAATNKIWASWLQTQGARQLLVLADLPGKHTDLPGTQDVRRQIVNLDECVWPPKTKTIRLVVQQSGINVLTSPRVK